MSWVRVHKREVHLKPSLCLFLRKGTLNDRLRCSLQAQKLGARQDLRRKVNLGSCKV